AEMMETFGRPAREQQVVAGQAAAGDVGRFASRVTGRDFEITRSRLRLAALEDAQSAEKVVEALEKARPASTPPADSAEDPNQVDAALRSTSSRMPSLLYARPSFNNSPQHFADLVAYAPGMNTSNADIEAVLETEALPDPRDRPGKVDAAARALFAKSRAPGWQAW